MKRFLLLLAAALLCTLASAAPRLIVVVVLDQFRYDYLVRFGDQLGEGGLRRLLNKGANFTSATYRHANNVTAAGHAVLLSGCYGWANGIVSNNWFDRASGRGVYCVADPSVQPVGGGREGRSPVNMVVGTFGDQLRVHTGFRGKVVSVSHKDRSAVLMGGQMPNGVYWLADSLFVSSTYYMQDLPAWVTAFNTSGAAQSYRGRVWERSLPVEAYAGMDSDDVTYEWGGAGLGRTFPHPVGGGTPDEYYQAMLMSPFGNDLLGRFAAAAIDGEELGADAITDLLCVSFSCMDYAGHAFGPGSQEIMDMVVQTDRVLAGFFDTLEAKVGLRNTLIVLSSDHGVTPIPEYLQREAPSLGARRIPGARLKEFCEGVLRTAFGPPPTGSAWILRLGHGSVYLDHGTLRKTNRDRATVARLLADSLARWPGIAIAVSADDLLSWNTHQPQLEKMRRSSFPGRTGDLLFALKPFIVLADGTQGADHGSPYDYDAHVPLIFMGAGVKPGKYARDVSPADLAPTLSAITGIEFPAGREGCVLTDAIDLP